MAVNDRRERRSVVGVDAIAEIQPDEFVTVAAEHPRRGARRVEDAAIEREAEDHVMGVFGDQPVKRLAFLKRRLGGASRADIG